MPKRQSRDSLQVSAKFCFSMRRCHKTPVQRQLGQKDYTYNNRRLRPLSRLGKPEYEAKEYNDEGIMQGYTLPPQRVLEGVVVGTSRDDPKAKMVLVRTWRWFAKVQAKKRYYQRYVCHDENDTTRLGDYVVIKELPGRKISENKWYYISEILRRSEPDLFIQPDIAVGYSRGSDAGAFGKLPRRNRPLKARQSGVHSWVHRHIRARKQQMFEEGKLTQE